MIRNPFKLLANLTPKPPTIPTKDVMGRHLTPEERKLIQHIGATATSISKSMQNEIAVNYDRARFYQEITRATDHWLVGPAVELYADYVSNYSQLHGASVWVTSENATYQRELTKLLDRIGIEEKIFDWAWTTAGYGDMFVEILGEPELGVIAVNDDEHPLNLSRIDHEGSLIGFYRTPQGQTTSNEPSDIIPPWKWVHLRILGAKRKRPQFSDPLYAEFRTMHLMTGTDTKQVTSRYGTSVLINALPTYKRLRLAEDSLLMARLTRGIMRYVWKLKVGGANAEAVNECIQQISGVLKKARAIDLSPSSPNFDSKFSVLAANEDLLIPVFSDDVGDLTFDKIGGEVDIRWIKDIEELRQELACTLRVPLQLLGGFVKEATGELGSQAIEKLDIRFARNARRLQRALKTSIKRICQIHLAYMNLDPDPQLFDVCMSESSTAEEESLKESLDGGVDIIDRMIDMVDKVDPEIDKVDVANYLSKKILKLEDFDLRSFKKVKETIGDVVHESQSKPRQSSEALRDNNKSGVEEPVKVITAGASSFNLDLVSYLPINESKTSGNTIINEMREFNWKEQWSTSKVKEEPLPEIPKKNGK